MAEHILGKDAIQVRFLLGAPFMSLWWNWYTRTVEVRVFESSSLSLDTKCLMEG